MRVFIIIFFTITAIISIFYLWRLYGKRQIEKRILRALQQLVDEEDEMEKYGVDTLEELEAIKNKALLKDTSTDMTELDKSEKVENTGKGDKS